MVKKRSVVVSIAYLPVVWFLVLVNISVCESSPSRPMKGFDHLLQITSSESVPFEPEKIFDIMEHVSSDSFTSQPVLDGEPCNSASAYYGFRVKTDMKRLLQYSYNSDIPSCAVMPSVIRLSSWRGVNGEEGFRLPEFSKELDGLDSPVIVKSSYYMQNTPDSCTGAYYGYDSYRTVILFRYNGKNALVSVLKQKDKSDVGRKGVILGEGEDWNYLYTGKTGLNLTGLGWIRSYVYDSFSVSVYIESDENASYINCGTFKWLNAGWAGKNMIRQKHIAGGLKKFAGVYKALLESETLPSPDNLATQWEHYNTLSLAEITDKMGVYLNKLQKKYQNTSGAEKILKGESGKDTLINKMSKSEMCSALIVQYVSDSLLKSNQESARLAFHKDQKKHSVN